MPFPTMLATLSRTGTKNVNHRNVSNSYHSAAYFLFPLFNFFALERTRIHLMSDFSMIFRD